MHLEEFMVYCHGKKGVEETFPFGEDTLVMKVMGKMWALCSITDEPFRINLKCDPERAIELRDEYEEIRPGYHMNKEHWNTIIVGEGTVPLSVIHELIDHSYELVVSKLSKTLRQKLSEQDEK